VVAARSEPDFSGHIGRTYQDSTPWWPDPPPGLGAPNVVVIVLDDTGFAHLGCYGSELATPNIAALARGGLR
jgi:Sulfatase